MIAREYASAAEMLESYAARRARLCGLVHNIPVVRGPVVRIPRPPKPTSTSSGAQILQWVASKHEMTIKELTGQTRMVRVSRARQEAMWMLRQLKGWGFPRIAKFVGLADHSSAAYACKTHAQRILEGKA